MSSNKRRRGLKPLRVLNRQDARSWTCCASWGRLRRWLSWRLNTGSPPRNARSTISARASVRLLSPGINPGGRNPPPPALQPPLHPTRPDPTRPHRTPPHPPAPTRPPQVPLSHQWESGAPPSGNRDQIRDRGRGRGLCCGLSANVDPKGRRHRNIPIVADPATSGGMKKGGGVRQGHQHPQHVPLSHLVRGAAGSPPFDVPCQALLVVTIVAGVVAHRVAELRLLC